MAHNSLILSKYLRLQLALGLCIVAVAVTACGREFRGNDVIDGNSGKPMDTIGSRGDVPRIGQDDGIDLVSDTTPSWFDTHLDADVGHDGGLLLDADDILLDSIEFGDAQPEISEWDVADGALEIETTVANSLDIQSVGDLPETSCGIVPSAGAVLAMFCNQDGSCCIMPFLTCPCGDWTFCCTDEPASSKWGLPICDNKPAPGGCPTAKCPVLDSFPDELIVPCKVPECKCN